VSSDAQLPLPDNAMPLCCRRCNADQKSNQHARNSNQLPFDYLLIMERAFRVRLQWSGPLIGNQLHISLFRVRLASAFFDRHELVLMPMTSPTIKLSWLGWTYRSHIYSRIYGKNCSVPFHFLGRPQNLILVIFTTHCLNSGRSFDFTV
jgi:hypothetical protein